MPQDKAPDQAFSEFVSYVEEKNETDELEQLGSKELQKKRLEQSFIPLLDTLDHSDIVGDQMKLVINKDGDTIVSIDVECGCGKKSQIVFDYE